MDLITELRAFDEERLNSEPWTCEQIAKAAADEIERLRGVLEDIAAVRVLVISAGGEIRVSPEDLAELWEGSLSHHREPDGTHVFRIKRERE